MLDKSIQRELAEAVENLKTVMKKIDHYEISINGEDFSGEYVQLAKVFGASAWLKQD